MLYKNLLQFSNLWHFIRNNIYLIDYINLYVIFYVMLVIKNIMIT